MIVGKTQISLVLLVALFGCCYTQITLPLKISNDNIFTTVKYGTDQCEINLTPSLDYCSNVISQQPQDSNSNHCGSEFIEFNPVIGGQEYKATFQLGNIQGELLYVDPNEASSQFYGTNQLCFGIQTNEFQKNTLIELFEEGKITEEKVFFSLNRQETSNSENSFNGQINIGAPNKSLVKGSLVELQSDTTFSDYQAKANRELTFFGEKIDTPFTVQFELTTPFISLTGVAFDNVLKTLTKQGIEYTKANQEVLLPSIENLQAIELPLLQQDGSIFRIQIQPQQYTRQVANGQYQLMMRPYYYRGAIGFGYPIFEAYYVGFNLPNKSVLISEKAEQKVSNFRGFKNTSE